MCIADILAHFAEFRSRIFFNEDVWNDARLIFKKLNEVNNCSIETYCSAVYVHMRMGDYAGHLRGHKWGPEVFFSTNYMQEAFKNVSNTYNAS